MAGILTLPNGCEIPVSGVTDGAHYIQLIGGELVGIAACDCDELKCFLTPKIIDSTAWVSIFRKPGNNETVAAYQIGAETLVETKTINKADYCPDGACSYNGVRIEIDYTIKVDDLAGGGGASIGSRYEIVGANTQSRGQGFADANEPARDPYFAEKSHTLDAQWNANGQIVLNHYVRNATDPALVEDIISAVAFRVLDCRNVII